MATVLLADDEKLFKILHRTLLRRDVCRLVKAPAEELPARIKAVSPDLVCLCVSAPAGRRALATLSGDKTPSTVPVIVLDVDGALAGTRLPRGFEIVGPEASLSGLADVEARLTALLERHLSVRGRVLDRLPTLIEVRCEGRGSSFRALTKDISPAGMFLKTDMSLARGERLDFELHLPDPDLGADRPRTISGSCEVVRRIRADAPEHQDLIPGAGVRFVDLDKEAQAALRRFTRAGLPRAASASTLGGSPH